MQTLHRLLVAVACTIAAASQTLAQPVIIQPQDPQRLMSGTGVSNLRLMGQGGGGTEITLAMDYSHDGLQGPTAIILLVVEKKDQKGVSAWFGSDAITVGVGRGPIATKIKYFSDEPGVPADLTTDRIRVVILNESGRAVIGGNVFLKTIKWGVPGAGLGQAEVASAPNTSASEGQRKSDAKARTDAQAREGIARKRQESQRKAEEKRLADEQRRAERQAKADAETRRKADAKATELAQAQETARQKVEAAEISRREAEAKARAKDEERRRQRDEVRAQSETRVRSEAERQQQAAQLKEEEKRLADETRAAEQRAKADEEARRKADVKAREIAQAKEQERLKAVAEEKARRDAEAQAQARAQAEAIARAQAAAKAQDEAKAREEIQRQQDREAKRVADEIRLADERARAENDARKAAEATASTKAAETTKPALLLAGTVPAVPSSPTIASQLKTKVTNVDVVNRSLDRSQMTIGVEFEYRDDLGSKAMIGVDVLSSEDSEASGYFSSQPVEIGRSRRNFVLVPVRFQPPQALGSRLSSFATDKVMIYLQQTPSASRMNIFPATMLLLWRPAGSQPEANTAPTSNRVEIDDFKQIDLHSGYVSVQYQLLGGPGRLRLRVFDSNNPASAAWFQSLEKPAQNGRGLQLLDLEVSPEAKVTSQTFTVDTIEIELLDTKGKTVARLSRKVQMTWAKP